LFLFWLWSVFVRLLSSSCFCVRCLWFMVRMVLVRVLLCRFILIGRFCWLFGWICSFVSLFVICCDDCMFLFWLWSVFVRLLSSSCFCVRCLWFMVRMVLVRVLLCRFILIGRFCWLFGWICSFVSLFVICCDDCMFLFWLWSVFVRLLSSSCFCVRCLWFMVRMVLVRVLLCRFILIGRFCWLFGWICSFVSLFVICCDDCMFLFWLWSVFVRLLSSSCFCVRCLWFMVRMVLVRVLLCRFILIGRFCWLFGWICSFVSLFVICCDDCMFRFLILRFWLSVICRMISSRFLLSRSALLLFGMFIGLLVKLLVCCSGCTLDFGMFGVWL